jgi:glycosyltransferase involved in cell wall biosynthesis
LKILIDFTHIPVQKAGVGVCAVHLVSNLISIDRHNKYVIVIQSDEDCFDNVRNDRIRTLKVNALVFRRKIFRICIEQVFIPFLIIRHKIEIVHSLHYSFPLVTFSAKKIVHVYDMTFFSMPEMHVPIKRVYFKFFIKLSSRLADRIITISKSTMEDYVSHFDYNREHISVVYAGRDERFTPNLDTKRIDNTKQKYKIQGEYLLYIGTLEPRKNIVSAIKAFKKVCSGKPDLVFVIAGKKGWYYRDIVRSVRELKLKDRVIFTGFVDEEEKPYLLAGSKLFIYPSFYEGFGIPVLEALSCGIPTVTSNVSSIPEITGDAAILIDPHDEHALYNAIMLLLNDSEMYRTLQSKSVEQSKKFKWKDAAEKVMNLYQLVSEPN